MALHTDPEFQDVVELIIQRRLRWHAYDLEQRKGEVENHATQPGFPQGYLARGVLFDAWADAFQKHCDQVLADLLVLLKIFDSLSSAEWIQQKFNTHVDQVSSKLVQRLMNFDFGVPSRSSERNKFINIASKIKNRAKRILDPEVERAAKRQREESKPYEPPQVELDDLLPLNRRGTFDEDLEGMVKAAKSTGEPLSLVMLDIDHFKGVNDKYGHPVGDEVLIAVAELAIKSLANKGKAYRYGGEEFALILPNLSVEEAVGLAERIRKDIEKTTVSSKSLKVTVSFGIASVPDHAKNSKTLLEKADAALYEAKNLGRNLVRFDGEPKPDKASSKAKKR
jgi:diguanylate cyclase (GGDEF)-like protein